MGVEASEHVVVGASDLGSKSHVNTFDYTSSYVYDSR